MAASQSTLELAIGSEPPLSEPSGSAKISPCGQYRYFLSRMWGDQDDCNVVTFIGLNPSTADASVDDPTLRRCMNYAKAWGYSGVWMVNLFGFRATEPKDMMAATDPIGPDNEDHLAEAIMQARLVIAAWGAGGGYRHRDKEVIARYGQGDSLACLGLTKDGKPRHPLYLKKTATPFSLNQ